MPVKHTHLERIVFEPANGIISCRFRPQTVYDDGEVQVHPPHMLTLYPGQDPDQTIEANNEHFRSGVMDARSVVRKYAPISAGDAAAIKAMADTFHTAEVVQAFRERVAAQLAAEAAQGVADGAPDKPAIQSQTAGSPARS